MVIKRVANTGQGKSNGGHLNVHRLNAQDGQPPPSTAARLVTGHAQQPNSFSALLHAVLHDENPPETNLEITYSAIQVVAKSGLDVLSLGVGSELTRDALLQQAKDSIAVIQTLIGDQPELLFYGQIDEQQKKTIEGTQMIYWLFAKLARAAANSLYTGLHTAITGLLSVLISNPSMTLDYWLPVNNIGKMYKSTVDDILHLLNGSGIDSISRDNQSVEIAIPSISSIAFLNESDKTIMSIPSGTQVTVKGVAPLFHAAKVILDAVMDVTLVKDRLKAELACTDTLVYWLGDAVISFCETFVQHSPSFESSILLQEYYIACIASLEKICFSGSLVESGYQSSDQVLVDCLCGLIRTSPAMDFADSAQSFIEKLLDPDRPVSKASMDQVGIANILLDEFDISGESDMEEVALSDVPDVIRWVNNRFRLASKTQEKEMIDVTNGEVVNTSKHETRLMPMMVTTNQQITPIFRTSVDVLKELFDMVQSENNHAVESQVQQYYTNLTLEGRQRLWRVLASIACAASNTFNGQMCSACTDDPRLQYGNRYTWNDNSSHGINPKIFRKTLEILLPLTENESSVLGIVAVRSFLLHTVHTESLEEDSLGVWCLKELVASSRDRRLTAARTIMVFLRDGLPEESRDHNRHVALDYFRRISEKANLSRHETLTYLWGQVAIVCDDQERNLAILRLIDYLGHTNAVISGLASRELERIAEAVRLEPRRLIRPFLNSIAIAVVQDMLIQPQKLQLFSDFMRASIEQFLVFSQKETIPFMILTKKKDVLKRIAGARSSTVKEICFQPKTHIAAIIASLLMQASDDPENFIAAMFTESVPDLDAKEVIDFIKIEPALIVVEMLKSTAGEDQAARALLHKAVGDLITITQKSGSGRSKTKGNVKAIGPFFESIVLGIMTRFSDTIDGMDENATAEEKIKCLGGIEEMINLAKSHVGVAVPQIRACLQSAMDQGGFVEPVISAWLCLVSELETDDVEILAGHFFALITKYFLLLSSTLQQRAYDTIANLLKKHNSMLREQILMIPSLTGLPLLSKFEMELKRLKDKASKEEILRAFAARLQDENAAVGRQTAIELFTWLESNQEYMHESAVSEPPSPLMATMTRALLDACVKYNTTNSVIADACARCLGIIGCLDPNNIEADVNDNQILVLSDFEQASEVIKWVSALFEHILVPAFRSAINARAQGFLAYVMQELLRFASFENVESSRPKSSQTLPAVGEAWFNMPESARNILTPFLTSHYVLKSTINPNRVSYPIFSLAIKYGEWIRRWVYDMLWRGKGDNAKSIFATLARVVMAHDVSIAKFLLPYAALNIVLGGDVAEANAVGQEMLTVLSTESTQPQEKEVLRQCSEDVFSVLDYMTRWVQEKKKEMAALRLHALRSRAPIDEIEENGNIGKIDSVEKVVSFIPPDIIAQRAIECGSYTRALLHWENHIREQLSSSTHLDVTSRDAMFSRLQLIYSEIDEPDGLDGIAAHINILTPEQQAFQHLRGNRWSAAQSWYEMEMSHDPASRNNIELQDALLTCLQKSGQHGEVIRLAEQIQGVNNIDKLWRPSVLSFAIESTWTSGMEITFKNGIEATATNTSSFNFNIALGKLLNGDDDTDVEEVRAAITGSLTKANTSSLSACHSQLLQLHILHEAEKLMTSPQPADMVSLFDMLDKRLEILGSSVSDKQLVLCIRRKLMSNLIPSQPLEIAKGWLTTARLARKTGVDNLAHFAVFSAEKLGDASSKIEQARLMWKSGQRRQAISHLNGAIESNAFAAYERNMSVDVGLVSNNPAAKQNMLAAKAHLLLAKWLDAAGQSESSTITQKYQFAARNYAKWEKGHYYLGKHYNKLLEANRNLPPHKQSQIYITGDVVKLVIENYTRSLPFGSKYWYETLPKIITLWLDLGTTCLSKPKDMTAEIFDRRCQNLLAVHVQLKKYFDRVPRYVFYTTLPQLISRINHGHAKVVEMLSSFISAVVAFHPAQGLWALLPVAKASSSDRAERGKEIINKTRSDQKRSKSDSLDIRTLVMQGQKLQDALLNACEAHIETRASTCSLSKDLQFSHKLAPNPLVVPFQQFLTPNIPTVQEATYIRNFKAFTNDRVTITSFSDEVLVLNSLQRPRKLTIRGSDGKSYGLLCKPKDDLRKDQRLMEFNTMINRALKHHPESSIRHLYIKTYGVTPLSEESGTIEWVEGIKPLRDILLKLYQRKGIQPNYAELRNQLNEASSHPDKYHLFTTNILRDFPPVLHEWFTELFPSPATWFVSRLRFSRSAAVMSMVGHVLGLGDRHGENILLRESTGGVFHVDFNCLFDKGLTFEKPELVPFRLTHNMVDAMGPGMGVEGPFRKCAELTMKICAGEESTLMNILETFVHDPTAEFVPKNTAATKGKKSTSTVTVGTLGKADVSRDVLDAVQSKLRGFLRGENVPLSVEGHVEALIKQATDEGNLCRMYIGWCPFL